MTKWLYRSGLLIILLMIAVGVDLVAGANLSLRQKIVDAGQIYDEQNIEDAMAATGTFSGGGAGFYMSIYADVVTEPNRLVEEEISRRFGVDFDLDFSPTEQIGPDIFLNYFEDISLTFFGSEEGKTVAPTLKDSLQSDCVRIKATQVEDEVKKWRILKNRLIEREKSLAEPDHPQPIDSSDEEAIDEMELVTRLVGQIDVDTKLATEKAIRSIPGGPGEIDDRQILLSCYRDFSKEVDYELRLQSILHPLRKKMEVMQTFVNGRVDDFENTFVGAAFPRYDLIFDINVIDFIVFGAPVATDTKAVGGGGGFAFGGSGSSPFADFSGGQTGTLDPEFESYADILALSSPPVGPGGLAFGLDSFGQSVDEEEDGASDALTGDAASDVDDALDSELASVGFGSSSGQYAGPFCPVQSGDRGLKLDYSDLGKPPSVDGDMDEDELAGEGDEEDATDIYGESGRSDEDDVGADGDGEAEGEGVGAGAGAGEEAEAVGGLTEGFFDEGPNTSTLCEGGMGEEFGDDLLRMIFCINIDFKKIGKSWEGVSDDNCIACHLFDMNRVFEEELFKASVRPHKNTGAFMESAVCEDGYGSVVGFEFFLEWVPVKFYPDICYPNEGITGEEYAELIGYPELVTIIEGKSDIDCNNPSLFPGESGDKCKEIINGDIFSYESYEIGYRAEIDKGIKSLDDADRQIIWAKLVGDQGIAEREMHFLLYRLGQAEELHGESVKVTEEMNYKKRMDDIRAKMKAIREGGGRPECKIAELMCLKGTKFDDPNTSAIIDNNPCNIQCSSSGTLMELDKDIDDEIARVAAITRRWNQRSVEFNAKNSCNTFPGAFEGAENTLKDIGSPGYYLQTDFRRTQSTSEQITGQVASNTDIEDFNSLFAEINEQVEFKIEENRINQEATKKESEQAEAAILIQAFGLELQAFKDNFNQFTTWWSEMVDNKKLTSRGGKKINILESFLEKAK